MVGLLPFLLLFKFWSVNVLEMFLLCKVQGSSFPASCWVVSGKEEGSGDPSSEFSCTPVSQAGPLKGKMSSVKIQLAISRLVRDETGILTGDAWLRSCLAAISSVCLVDARARGSDFHELPESWAQSWPPSDPLKCWGLWWKWMQMFWLIQGN